MVLPRIALLLVLLIIPGVVDPVPPAHAAICSASLTLTLQPGLHISFPGQPPINIPPKPDIPPGPVTIQLPLYPGAVASTVPLRQPFIQYSLTPYLKTAVAEFRTIAGWNAVASWYRASILSCGYKLEGSGSAGKNGRVISKGFMFVSTTDRHLSVSIAFERASGGGTLVLYLAEDNALPPRPATSFVPASTVRIKLTYTPWPKPGGALITIHRTITKPGTIHKLVTAVNALTDIATGVRMCASEFGQGATMRFIPQTGPSVQVVDNPACWIVTVNHTGLDDVQGGVWDTLTKLHLPHGT